MNLILPRVASNRTVSLAENLAGHIWETVDAVIGAGFGVDGIEFHDASPLVFSRTIRLTDGESIVVVVAPQPQRTP